MQLRAMLLRQAGQHAEADEVMLALSDAMTAGQCVPQVPAVQAM